jgi:outer membrane lipoprotein-sorting protein
LLEGWTTIDAQNKRTTVKLDGQRYNVAVAENAFAYAEPQKRRR